MLRGESSVIVRCFLYSAVGCVARRRWRSDVEELSLLVAEHGLRSFYRSWYVE